jgi:hypothetical protein
MGIKARSAAMRESLGRIENAFWGPISLRGRCGGIRENTRTDESFPLYNFQIDLLSCSSFEADDGGVYLFAGKEKDRWM